MDYTPQVGDIFLCDSSRLNAKIVKFLMQSPTIYHQIWRYFRHTLEPVYYYHAGMVISENQIIEQQFRVQKDDLDKILTRDIIIWRKKDLTKEQQDTIKQRATEDIGKTYGIILVIAKTLTWVTGVKLFINILGALDRQHEICINRVCKWYNHICDFGSPKYFEDNTKTVNKYCEQYPEEWEIIYLNKGV